MWFNTQASRGAKRYDSDSSTVRIISADQLNTLCSQAVSLGDCDRAGSLD